MNSHNIFLKFPTLDLGVAELRQIQEEDTEDFYHYILNDHVKEFLADEDIPKNLSSAKSELMYWANLYLMLRSIYWGIADTKSGHLIGTCGFNSWNRAHRRAEISYDLSFDYWGQGIMTRAVQAITEFAFDEMKVLRVQATVSTDNAPSIRVLEKCGYKKEGVMKKFGLLHGAVKDFYMYAAIRQA